MDSNPTAESNRNTIRIFSWNIKHSSSIGRLANIIDRSRADFVFLQEVDCETARNGFVDVPFAISRKLAMNMAFAPTIELKPKFSGMTGDYGLCVLSRVPFSSCVSFRLDVIPIYTGQSKTEPKIAQICTVILGDKQFVLINTHLSAPGRDNDLRRGVQLRAISDLSKEYAHRGPVIIAGDLNSEPAQLASLGFWRSSGFKAARLTKVTFKPRRIDQTKYRNQTLDYVATRGCKVTSLDTRFDLSVSDHCYLQGELHADC